MTPASPYTVCSNGCGVPAKWKVTKNGRTRNMCNACVTKSHDCGKSQTTRTNAEKSRKREVLERLGY